MDFKIGDTVKVIDEKVPDDRHLIGTIGKVVETPRRDKETYDVDFGKKIEQDANSVNETTHRYLTSEIELVKKGDGKIKPDDLVRYMVYGTGCDNKGSLRHSEKELKEDLKRCVRSSSWTGRVIGYKLVPLYEAELTTKLSIFKTTKLKKVSKKTAKKK